MKNGFTLVELLAVIAILAIISLITLTSTGNTIDSSKNKLSELQKTNIERAAETYYIKEGMNEDATCVNLSTLIEKGYFDVDELKNPEDNSELRGSVLIEFDSNQYIYTYQDSDC